MLSTFRHFLSPQQLPSGDKPERSAILNFHVPKALHLALQTERGEVLYPRVVVSQQVSRGELIADSMEGNAPLHSPIDGYVSSITHTHDKLAENIIIHPVETISVAHEIGYKNSASAQDSELIYQKIEHKGIVGMGGAGFSTIEKIKLSRQKEVHTVLVNLCECEPIISCDQTLAEQYPKELLAGIMLSVYCTRAKTAIIIIEDDKKHAIKQIQNVINLFPAISLHAIAPVYPSGHERQLVEYVSNNKVSAHSFPIDYRYMVINVATCYAIYRAYYHEEPLIQRLITISDGTNHINQWVLIGTPISELLQTHHIAYDKHKHHLIMGGPMNGKVLDNVQLGVSKNMNCLLVLPQQQHTQLSSINTDYPEHLPCIRCGECVEVCPANLLPQQLYWFAQAQQHQKAEEFHLFDCIECGNCAFVCPSKIPLVQYYRVQKKHISELKLEQTQIQKAKERFEKRTLRLEQEKKRHQEMLKAKRLQAQQKLAEKQAALKLKDNDDSNNKAPSQAVAIARAKALAKKQQLAKQNTSSK